MRRLFPGILHILEHGNAINFWTKPRATLKIIKKKMEMGGENETWNNKEKTGGTTWNRRLKIRHKKRTKKSKGLIRLSGTAPSKHQES